MMERIFFVSDLQWFWHSVSYNRTRFFHAGDYLAFRPGLMAILALEDIFLRRHLFVQGLLAIVIQSCAAYSLYATGRLLINRWMGGIFAVLFIVQYAGTEMIIWRHITPYLLSLTFLCFGLLSWIKTIDEQKGGSYRSAAFLNFIATLFHELAFIALAGTGALLFINNAVRKRRNLPALSENRSILIVFISPAVLYGILSALDLLYYHPPGMLGPDEAVSQGFSLLSALGALIDVFASAGSAFLFPFIVGLREDIVVGTLNWGITETHAAMRPIGGILAGAAWIAVLLSSVRGSLRDPSLSRNTIGIFSSVLLFVITAGVGLGRVYLR
ncbi:MAG: hypothetical protein HZA17_02255, partial [Nitrospirae bacterium]|nr:hypothetical protein [Nitrospirota bacterium]